MKRCFSRYRLALFALSIVSSTMIAEQIWRGTSVRDVIDEDLVIKDDVLLPLGGTRIEAIHKDVTVTLSRDVTISGHWAGETQLYLVAAEGHTIRFELDHNITFTGSSQITSDDLLVVQSGPGTVQFAIGEGRTFRITSENGSGGVQWYVLMYGGIDAPIDEYCCDEYCLPPIRDCCDEYLSGGLFNDEYSSDEYCSPGNGVNENSLSRPRLQFIPLNNESPSNRNRQVVIGPNSIMSFLSSRKVDVAQDSAFIEFDAAINGAGRMILEVDDTGAFIVAGSYTCQRSGSCLRLRDINRAVAAGFEAVWATMNGLGANFAAGLLVLDQNKTLSELLVDPFLNLDARNDITGFRGLFSGIRYGVVVGANGVLSVLSNSYVDFVGLDLNQIPDVVVPGFDRTRALDNTNTSKLIKVRNASALIFDGNNNPNSTPARIEFAEKSALFLRSGVAENGEIRGISDVDPFTIDAAERTPGFGNIVLDVEGELIVHGSPVADAPLTVSSKIELLSLEVLPTGGTLFVGSLEIDFPRRTFNTEDNELLQYNKGAFLINNQMSLFNTALSHTDVSHNIFPNNDLRSEPAYIGGETFKLLNSSVRPSINFLNSYLLVNADIALTGVDLVVPNLVEDDVMLDNLATFIFYANGACVDSGTGRQMILGTRIGSTAADGCSRIDGEAYLDIMEKTDALTSDFNPDNPNGNQTLSLMTSSNNSLINNLIDQVLNNSIHTIFLGGCSNISIGVNADTTGFNIDTNPWLRIQGSVFSFETKPGAVARSIVTGKNAIFVDLNGKISIDPGFIANFGVMVIKSHNGIVDLPADQVFFSNGAGIATWNVNLSVDQTIVSADQALSSFIFNWILAQKACPPFVPFSCCVDSCMCPAATIANITGLPIISGTVDVLQIQGTRIGDPAQFLISGGTVRELSFAPNSCGAEAAVAVIVLENNGQVGLDGTAPLGANGITIIANGSGRVLINDDIVINNTCSIVKGPDFGSCDVLQLYSALPRQILLKSSGTLNLTSFDDVNQIVQIGGELKLVVEPGATIATGMGTLRFADNARLLFEPSTSAFDFFNDIPFGLIDNTLPITTIDASEPHNALSTLTNFGEGLSNTDQFRVKIGGQGTIEFRDTAEAQLPFNAFVGIESINTPTCSIPVTDITIAVLDNGAFEIGRLNYNEGGVLQIGNVSSAEGDSVSFTLELDGDGANFSIGSRGFLGLGAGVERFDAQIQTDIIRQGGCPISFISNNNIISTLSDVDTITFRFMGGRFEHDRIFSGDDVNASLIAVGDNEGMTFTLDFEIPDENVDSTLERISNFNVAAGGNMVLVTPGIGGVQPVVLEQDGVITARLSSSIMASSLLQAPNDDVANLTSAEFFDYFKTHDATLEVDRINTLGRANAASQGDSFRPEHQNIRLGAVSLGAILRTEAFDIVGAGQNDSKRRNAIDTAAAFTNINPAINSVVSVTNIES